MTYSPVIPVERMERGETRGETLYMNVCIPSGSDFGVMFQQALSVASSVHKVSGHDRDALLGTRGSVAPPARTGTRLLCRWCMWARRTPATPARPMARLTSAQKGLVQHALSANT